MIMRKSLMVSVAAAALLTATGLASAQGMKNDAGAATASPRSDSTATMTKPSAGAAMQKDTAAPGREAAESDTKTGSEPKAATTAQEKGGTKATPQQAQQKSDTKAMPQQAQQKSDSKSSDTRSGTMANDTKSKSMDSKASDSGSKPTDSKASDSGTARPATADSKTGTDTKSSTTTGNAATSATVAPPAEKRTQISAAIKQQKVEEVTNVNFNISVGTRVPASVRFYPVPRTVVEIYPEWRGYDFIFVRGEYIILRPGTHEIVYILEI
jgi:hypothetical protein